MEQAAFQRWWELHLRVARGEPLAPEEQTIYEAVRESLEADETLRDVQSTRESREKLKALEVERSQLEHRRQKLNNEIATLEKKPQRG